MKTKLLTFIFVLFNFNLFAQNIEVAQQHLQKAHEAFLDQNYALVPQELISVFKYGQNNKYIRENANLLLEETYKDSTENEIDVDWKLPEKLEYLKIGYRKQVNKLSNYIGHKIDIVGLLDEPSDLENIKITKYPNEVVINLDSGIGNFSSWKNKDGNGFYIGNHIDHDRFDGLYFINIKIKGEKLVKGWFIASNILSSATPEIISPKDGDVFTQPSPILKWKNFVSPEYKGFEKRKLNMKITNFDSKRERVWNFSKRDPKLDSLDIAKNGNGMNSLKAGSYLLHVNYSEKKKFGPIYLSRDSRTIVGFEVK